MGALDDVVDRIRYAFQRDKERGGSLLAKGSTSPTYPDSGYDLLQSYGYDALSDYLRLEHDLLSRFVDYEEMDDYPEISAAVDIYADDASQPDTQIKRTVWVTSKDKALQTHLDDWLHKRLRMDEEIWEIARSLVKYGNDYEELLINHEGVVGLNFLPAPTVRRIEGARGELHGFIQDFKGRFGYCLARGSRVWSPGGVQEIQEFSGNAVLGHREGSVVPLPLKKRHASGTKRVFRLCTRHREVYLTEDHPVLVDRQGRQEWVKVKDLKLVRYGGKKRNIDYSRTDKIVICTRMASGEVPEWSQLFRFDPFEAKQGEKGNPVNLCLPERITPEICRFYGFMLGDGWVESDRRVSFAEKVYEDRNQRYTAIVSGLGFSAKLENRQYRVNSVQFARFLRALGWIDGAENKRIPQWVYALPEAHREELWRGFLDSDAWETRTRAGTPGHHLELANYDLVRDLKNLVDGLGYKSGRIGSRKREPGTIIKDRSKGREVVVQTQRQCFNLHVSSKKFESDFVSQAIIRLEYYEDCDVYDLEVDDPEHNFIADGVVVHNSPQEFQKILSQRSAAIRSIGDKNNALPGARDYMSSHLSAMEPWEVVHFRLRGKHRRSVYGYSVLESSRWIWKRLLLMEDAAMIYRLQRAQERYAFYVDTGDLPPEQALAFVNRVRQQHRKKKFVNSSNNKMDLKFAPISPDEDFYVPVRKGVEGTRIETLGSPSWQHMEDVNYFRSKLLAALKVPKAYLAQEEGASKSVLSSEDVRFARSVLRVQRELRNGLKRMGRVHLAALKVDPSRVDFEMNMTVPSAIYELAQIEVRNARADLATRMREHVSLNWVLANVYGLTDSDIERVIKERSEDVVREGKAQAEVEKMSMQAQQAAAPPIEGFGPPPSIKRLQERVKRTNRNQRGGISEEELFRGNREAEKRASEKLDKLLRNDAQTARRLGELGGLIRDVAYANRKTG